MRRTLLVLVFLAAACGATADSTTTTTTTVDGGSSTTTTTTSSATTSTTAPPNGGSTYMYTGEIPSLPGSDGALGSGCTPGGELTDGVWFGLAVDWTETAVEFDLACWYSGERAEEIGRQRGEEVNNDYLIVNDNPTTRQVPFAEGARGWRLTDSVELEQVDLSEFLSEPGAFAPCPGEFCGVWLFVNSGVVTEVVRQYQP